MYHYIGLLFVWLLLVWLLLVGLLPAGLLPAGLMVWGLCWENPWRSIVVGMILSHNDLVPV